MSNTSNRVLIAVVLAAAGLAIAEPPKADPKSEPKKEVVPAKKIVPSEAPKKIEKKTEGKLQVGSAAPKLVADKWVKGGEVKGFEKGKVYVVEFWATWCGPCIKGIPHMTELAKKHSDVTFIAMASSERKGKDDKDDKRLEKVEKFVKDQGDAMGYTVAYDGDRKMSTGWMEPAGQNGIPCAFVVDGEGKIAFIGHPMDQKFADTLGKLSTVKDEPKKDGPKTDSKVEPKDQGKTPEKKK